MRSMAYTDSRGQRQRLTWEQWVYLDTAGRQFDYGWGGLRSTLTVRLLRERGLIELNDSGRYSADSGHRRWRVTGRTALGDQVIELWRERAAAE